MDNVLNYFCYSSWIKLYLWHVRFKFCLPCDHNHSAFTFNFYSFTSKILLKALFNNKILEIKKVKLLNFTFLFFLTGLIPYFSYFAVSVNLFSRITTTLIWPGYCISFSIFLAISFTKNIASPSFT